MPRWLVAVLTLVAVTAGACTSSGEDEALPETTTTVTAAPQTTTTVPTEPATPDPAQLDADPADVYSQDFEQVAGSEWSLQDSDTTSDGRTVLGPFGTDRVTLQLTDLPAHDALSISFDLLILGDWTGGEQNGDRWLLTIEGSQVINTTFANNDGEQGYPSNLPAGGNPGGSGATERAWYGLTSNDEDSGIADNLYPVQRDFLHSGRQVTVDFSARQLGLFDDQAWAIDSITVTASALPDRQTATDVSFTVTDQALSVSGTVATEDDLQLLEEAMTFRFGNRSAFDELTVGAGGPKPLWFYDTASLASVLAPSDDLRLRADETSASASGTVRTTRWADVYQEQMAAVFGDDIQPSTDFEIAFDDSFVDRLDGLDLRFETASAELDDEDRESLDEVAALMADNENLIIRINGHTDSTGEDDGNKNLSRDRADAAYEYLLAAGADKDRLTANARGASDPKVDPEQSEADRATNRRVSFVIPRG